MAIYKKLLSLLIVIGILLIIIIFLRDILIPFFLAVLVAYLFYPAVKYFETKTINPVLAIIIIYASIATILIFFIFAIFPVFYKEMNDLLTKLPSVFKAIENKSNGLINLLYQNNLPDGLKNLIIENFLNLEKTVTAQINLLTKNILSMLAYTPILLILTPILSFYFLHDSKKIALSFINLFPEKYHPKITAFIYDLNITLMKYVRGNILIALLVGIITTIGLFIIKMPLAIMLGSFAAISELIPVFGPFISATLAIIVAFTVSSQKAFLALLLFILIQQIEANVITPKILGECVGAHPLLIIFLILLGGNYFGIAGMFFAVPIFAVFRIIANHLVPLIRNWNDN